MKELVADNYQSTFRDFDSFLHFLKQTYTNSEWFPANVKRFEFVHLESLPLRAQEYAEDYLCSRKAIEDTMKHTRLLMKVDDRYLPLRDTAVKSALERVKIGGSALRRLKKEKLADVLNWCAQVAGGEAKIHMVADKISAVLGNDYVVLPISDIFEGTERYLKQAFGKVKFIEGYFVHDYVTGLWELPKVEGEAKLKYKTALEKLGATFEELVPCLRVTTSNTGASGANLYPSIRHMSSSVNLRLCPDVRLNHKGSASMDRFMENLSGVHSRITQSMEQLLGLYEITIEYPANAMTLIYKRIGAPKRYAAKVIEKYRQFYGDKTCTAYALFFNMHEIIQYMKENPKERDPIGKAIELEELLGKIPFMDFTEYDLPGNHTW